MGRCYAQILAEAEIFGCQWIKQTLDYSKLRFVVASRYL